MGSSRFSKTGAGCISNADCNAAGCRPSLAADNEEAVGGPLNLSVVQVDLDFNLGEPIGELFTASLESDRRSKLGPNGDCDVFNGDPGRDKGFVRSISLGREFPARGVGSALARCAFRLARSAIQLGWLFFAGASCFGDSGLVNELSSQLDLAGLKRLVGLPGDARSAPSSFAVLWKDATDLLRLWRARVGFMDPSPSSSFVFGRLLLLELVGRDRASGVVSLLAGAGSKCGMLEDP